MKKLTTLFATLLSIFFACAQNEHGFSSKQPKVHTWEKAFEGRAKFRFGFNGLPQPIFQFTGEGIVPLKLGKEIPTCAMLVTTRFGYSKTYSWTTGIGGCIGKQNFFIAPQAVVALGQQNGFGLGLTAQAKNPLLKFYYESSFIIDYHHNHDSWFSVTEFVVSPKIKGERPLNIGLEVENCVSLEREEIVYAKAENELETSMYVHYFPNEFIFIGCGFGTAPVEIREKSFLKASYISFCMGFRFENHRKH